MSAPENPPAFPREDYQCDNAPGQRGMTLRDWFAGQLAPICFAQHHGNDWGQAGVRHAQVSAELAYAWADALLAQRSEGE